MAELPTKLHLTLVTREKKVLEQDVDEVVLPAVRGQIGILPGHTPLLAMLKPGELWYRKGQDRTFFVLDFGMAEVLPDKVTVLVRLADKPEEIDVDRQEADRRKAESELQHAGTLEDAERARIAMLTAMMKQRAAERVRMKKGI